MLRAIFVLAIIAVGLRYSLKGPFYVLLFYLWIAYFRPEQWLWWDFVSSLNLSLIVGASVVISAALFGEELQFGIGPALLFAFLGQSLLSTVLSPMFSYAWPYFLEFVKTIVISYLLITLLNSEQRLRAVLVVIGLSLGFEGAKQGWLHFLLHPGAPNANGSPLLGDNNGVAVGMLMLVPLALATARTAPQWTERVGEQFLAVGVLLRAVVTYSRGGILAAGALGLHYLWRSKHKLGAMIVIAAIVAIAAATLPDRFWSRMETIGDATNAEGESGISTAGRLHFWRVAINMASANPLVGVGHNAFNAMYSRYDFSGGQFGEGRSVHSAWFGVLAELGYPGLLIFISLLGRGFFVARRARRRARDYPTLANLALYATAIEASLLVFAIGGSFVPFQYTELLWHVLALSIVVDRLVQERVALSAPSPRATSVTVSRRPPSAAAVAFRRA